MSVVHNKILDKSLALLDINKNGPNYTPNKCLLIDLISSREYLTNLFLS